MSIAFQNFGWQDVVDVGLLSFIFYRILIFVKGTRTVPMLMGISLVMLFYALSRFLQLEALELLLENLATSLVLVLVILFQGEFRNALAQFGLITFFRENAQLKKDLIEETLQACITMSQLRIGALIVFERELGLRNYIEKGTPIDAVLTKELLLSLFHPTSPLHDGAVIVDRKGRVSAAGCLLPISMNNQLSSILGTRHRSAIGLTEETDAVVLVVSEERSELSLGYKGKLIRGTEGQNIKELLLSLLQEEPLKKLIHRKNESSTPSTSV